MDYRREHISIRKRLVPTTAAVSIPDTLQPRPIPQTITRESEDCTSECRLAVAVCCGRGKCLNKRGSHRNSMKDFVRVLFLLAVVVKCCGGLNINNARSVSNTNEITTRSNQRGADNMNMHYREYCSSCGRPPIQCMCDYIPTERISLQTDVLVLQHPTEFRRKTISTVPLLRLILDRFQLIVGRSFDESSQLNYVIQNATSRGQTPLLLFPGPDAITLEDVDASMKLEQCCEKRAQEGDSDGMDAGNSGLDVKHRYLLIVVDGTWTQAKGIIRTSPILSKQCQLIQFTGTSHPSIYNLIRKQPATHCLSTLESCARTLQLLEPDNPQTLTATCFMRTALKALVRTQLEQERISWAKNPDSIRNFTKIELKKKRQQIVEDKTGITGIPVLVESESRGGKQVSEQFLSAAKKLGGGFTLRPLVPSDADFVDSIWPYRSSKSLKMIQRQISADNRNATRTGGKSCSLGIEKDNDGQLIACILRHRNGSLGILYVDDGHRRRGFGETLLKEATDAMLQRGDPSTAFIVDGNTKSEALFTKMGWNKVDYLAKKGEGKRGAKIKWVYETGAI